MCIFENVTFDDIEWLVWLIPILLSIVSLFFSIFYNKLHYKAMMLDVRLKYLVQFSNIIESLSTLFLSKNNEEIRFDYFVVRNLSPIYLDIKKEKENLKNIIKNILEKNNLNYNSNWTLEEASDYLKKCLENPKSIKPTNTLEILEKFTKFEEKATLFNREKINKLQNFLDDFKVGVFLFPKYGEELSIIGRCIYDVLMYNEQETNLFENDRMIKLKLAYEDIKNKKIFAKIIQITLRPMG